MPPGTCASLLSLPPEDTSTEASMDETWHMCSQRAFCEHWQSHSARGLRLGGLPSVPWHIAAARCPGRLCLWFWPDLTLASSWSNLRIWGGHRSCERGWILFQTGPRPRPGACYDALWCVSQILYRWDRPKQSSININVVHIPLCMYITKTQRLPYFWRSMQYNQMRAVKNRGFTDLTNDRCIANKK